MNIIALPRKPRKQKQNLSPWDKFVQDLQKEANNPLYTMQMQKMGDWYQPGNIHPYGQKQAVVVSGKGESKVFPLTLGGAKKAVQFLIGYGENPNEKKTVSRPWGETQSAPQQPQVSETPMPTASRFERLATLISAVEKVPMYESNPLDYYAEVWDNQINSTIEDLVWWPGDDEIGTGKGIYLKSEYPKGVPLKFLFSWSKPYGNFKWDKQDIKHQTFGSYIKAAIRGMGIKDQDGCLSEVFSTVFGVTVNKSTGMPDSKADLKGSAWRSYKAGPLRSELRDGKGKIPGEIIKQTGFNSAAPFDTTVQGFIRDQCINKMHKERRGGMTQGISTQHDPESGETSLEPAATSDASRMTDSQAMKDEKWKSDYFYEDLMLFIRNNFKSSVLINNYESILAALKSITMFDGVLRIKNSQILKKLQDMGKSGLNTNVVQPRLKELRKPGGIISEWLRFRNNFKRKEAGIPSLSKAFWEAAASLGVKPENIPENLPKEKGVPQLQPEDLAAIKKQQELTKGQSPTNEILRGKIPERIKQRTWYAFYPNGSSTSNPYSEDFTVNIYRHGTSQSGGYHRVSRPQQVSLEQAEIMPGYDPVTDTFLVPKNELEGSQRKARLACLI